MVLILLSSGVIALEDITFQAKPMLVDMEFYLDKILTVLFLIEIYITRFSMGFVSYFSNAWCWIDFIVVGMSVINSSAELLGLDNIQILKVHTVLWESYEAHILGYNKYTFRLTTAYC